MSKRMQILMDEAEYREIQRVARTSRMTVAEWVRQVLRAARRQEPSRDIGKKLDAVRAATQYSFPTGDITQMLDDIEKGYLGGDES